MVKQIKTPRQIGQVTDRHSGLGSLLFKQLTASVVCFLLLLGMNSSGNIYIKRCAAAFGKALRYDSGFEDAAKKAADKIMDILKSEEMPQNTADNKDPK